MNKDDLTKLIIELDIPRLSAMRYVYAIQGTPNGIQFGVARNKYGAKKVEIEKNNETYNIRFIYFKADYKTFTPPVKKVKYEENNITAEHLRTVLAAAFKY